MLIKVNVLLSILNYLSLEGSLQHLKHPLVLQLGPLCHLFSVSLRVSLGSLLHLKLFVIEPLARHDSLSAHEMILLALVGNQRLHFGLLLGDTELLLVLLVVNEADLLKQIQLLAIEIDLLTAVVVDSGATRLPDLILILALLDFRLCEVIKWHLDVIRL